MVANDNSSLVWPDYKLPSSKSNCTIFNKWHVISVAWSNHKNLSNCWSNGERLIIKLLILVKLRVPITALLTTLA